jgi:hypothetical protein
MEEAGVASEKMLEGWGKKYQEKLAEMPGIEKWMGEIASCDGPALEATIENTGCLLESGRLEECQEVVRETLLVTQEDGPTGAAFVKKTEELLEYVGNLDERWPWYLDAPKEQWLAHKAKLERPIIVEKYIALVRPVSSAAYPSSNYKFDAKTLIEQLLPRLQELDNDLEKLYFDVGYLTRKR